ncbi:hypothetical protein RHMOL_Rhmol03G0263400 [Rhododendron molle]|uniref:Uncharacterized protein n=1 Tax=Rhododendron molle TaxID=49168 RepID=A0ACC0PIS7_RHOML|nr:hypothetical protein RHMOL_Rhmol03G0263400 [Rhododendron molle]
MLKRFGIELGADLGALNAVGVEEVVVGDRVSGADAVGEAEEAVDLDARCVGGGEEVGDPDVEVLLVAEEGDEVLRMG